MDLGEPLSDQMSSLGIRSGPDYESCFLSRLPRNIQWKIFGFFTESVGEMRLVSKSWRAILDEWAIPENLPELLVIDIFEKNSRSVNVIIEIRKSEAACFGRLRELVKELKGASYDECFSEIPHCSDITLDLSYGSEDIARLASVISRKSKIVHITRNAKKYRGSRFFDAVCALLANLERTTDLNYSRQNINEESENFLIKIMSKFDIQKMSISVDAQYDARELLTEMSKQIETIAITQRESGEKQQYPWTSSGSWINFILVMFHTGDAYYNGVTSIELNTYYVDLFTSDDVRLLAEFLKSRSEPFHFHTILHKEPKPINVDGLRIRIVNNFTQWIVDLSSLPPPPNAALF